jgi:hypothetical protein
MSEDNLKESNNEKVSVDDYQAKEETTLTTSDISNNKGKDREKSKMDNSNNDKENKKD